MNGVSIGNSRNDHYARSIGESLSKGETPTPSAELEEYLDRSPDMVLHTLDALVQSAAEYEATDPLILGYLTLIEWQLARIRHRADRGHHEAAQLLGDFQHAMTDCVTSGRIDAKTFYSLTSALHCAGIAASEGLTALAAQQAEEFLLENSPFNLAAASAALVEECQSDPFRIARVLSETGHAVPVRARAQTAAVLAGAPEAPLRETAVLLLLDPEPTVRRAATSALHNAVAEISPASLRRLIVMRNWCPANERPGLDAIIRAARAKGIECAPSPSTATELILASGIDGSRGQGFLIVSRDGQEMLMSTVLLKGIIFHAEVSPPQSATEIQHAIVRAAAKTPMIRVSRGYFDQSMGDGLARGVRTESLPPAAFLQVAETAGGADWQPKPLHWADSLASMLAETPEAMLTPEVVGEILQASLTWGVLEGVSVSWSEDDQEISRMMSGVHGRSRNQFIDDALTTMARRRDRWAELFAKTSFWLHEQTGADVLSRNKPVDANFPWREFAILADALNRGHDVGKLPLMRAIAERAVAVRPC
jgi:hypothetical protein